MITPLEIQNKEFKKVMRGYKESEVDEFLDKIIVDYEKVFKENIELKDKITLLNEQIDRYVNLEKTLNNTLVVAQSTAEEVGANSQKKAEIIINEAELKANRMISDAKDEVLKVKRQYEEAKKEMEIFKIRFRTLLEAQLEAISINTVETTQNDQEMEWEENI